MPHCIIEYAAPLEEDIKIKKLVKAVHKAASASGLFQGPDIKSRAIAYDDYKVGDGEHPFVHTTIKLLAGRTPEQKQHLGKLVLAAKQELLSDISDIALSVEVVELSNDYFK